MMHSALPSGMGWTHLGDLVKVRCGKVLRDRNYFERTHDSTKVTCWHCLEIMAIEATQVIEAGASPPNHFGARCYGCSGVVLDHPTLRGVLRCRSCGKVYRLVKW